MSFRFRRIAIINRGEPAMRLVRAVRDINAEFGADLRTIALVTSPDLNAPFAREADEFFSLGSASFIDPVDGHKKNRYIDYNCLEDALRRTRADAVWVGWGFVAEHPEFAELCGRLGVVFIGPPPEVMRKLGDKIESKRIAEAAGFPVAPWSNGPVDDVASAMEHARRIGFPCMLKATAGGGGRGIRRINSEGELASAFHSAKTEALKAFGNGDLFLEKAVSGARHVEVQVIADAHGNCWALGVRDCTIQRRNQKVLEEAPSPALSPEIETSIRNDAVSLAKESGYVNAGTVECLYETTTGQYHFMEMNTRLQVEHPVTELTTGVDIVKLQLLVANGQKLIGAAPETRGWAIEVRLNAEDPDNGFAPCPGKVDLFRMPVGPGIRIDAGLAQGNEIPPEFDSMIAKIIAFGNTRAEALGRLKRALDECEVVVRDGTTNAAFLRSLLTHPDVAASNLDIGWLDRLTAGPGGLAAQLPNGAHGDLALLTAAVDEAAGEHTAEVRDFIISCSRGRPDTRENFGISIDLRGATGPYTAVVNRASPKTYRITVGEKTYAVDRTYHDAFTGGVEAAGKRHRVLTSLQGAVRLVEIDGTTHRVSRDCGGLVRSPASAIILSISVKPGEKVRVGDRLLTLEAMKMETAVTAPSDGTVGEILVVPNQQVAPGAPLIAMEADECSCESSAPEKEISFSLTPLPNEIEDYEEFLSEVEALLMGYDADPKRVADFVKRNKDAEGNSFCCPGREQTAVAIFADLVALHAHSDDPDSDHPSGEPLRHFLRTFDKGSISEAFALRLSRHMQRYEIEELTLSRKLEEALTLTHRAYRRLPETLPAIRFILENCLDRDGETAKTSSLPQESTRETISKELLDDLLLATQTSHPAVNNLAKTLRHRAFDIAQNYAARERVYEKMAARIDSLASGEPRREEIIQEITECPFPFIGFLLQCLLEPKRAEAALEVLLQHYYREYRERKFKEQNFISLADSKCLLASLELKGKTMHVLLAAVAEEKLADFRRALKEYLHGIPQEDDLLVDIFAANCKKLDLAAEAKALTEDMDSQLVRICITAAFPGNNLDVVTLRREADEGWREEELIRGLHPVEAKRFELWRMNEFNVKRIHAKGEDIHLFHLSSKSNSKDERLLVFAEIRDLTPIRDEFGKVAELPHFEQMFREAATCLREALIHMPTKKEPSWNRIILNVAPPLTGQEREFILLAHKLQPYVENLNLEKVVVKARILDAAENTLKHRVVEFATAAEKGLKVAFLPPRTGPLKTLTEYERRVIGMRSRGQVYAYEIINMLTPSRASEQAEFPAGEFVELDFEDETTTKLTAVDRPHGKNECNIVVGLVKNFTERCPEGMERMLVIGDGSRGMGSLAEPECKRIIAALDLAEKKRIPFEWFPVSSGAHISMDSGTENLDWTARVLRRIIEFTEAGGEINLVVSGINVGAQSYWNAEATMLMHTRGILIMTPQGAMVLTGKKALDYSGGVSAEDNQGIGGFERIMGPNGQAQYFAKDLREACRILFLHYDFTYIMPGEKTVRRANTTDPTNRDPGQSLHSEPPFAAVGEIYSDKSNPGRKKPFDMRSVLAAAVDQDLPTLERWKDMREAETAIVMDAFIGGIPACVIGIESKQLRRQGYAPGDGPDSWAGGTLFPLSSKKVARAINSASGNRPVVALANLSGFDGSPESLRRLQLEYGAEIGRAVVKCKSPIVFCVITRFHGGAYVVFSTALNDRMHVAALKGSYASVIGGTPAAAVVFPKEVRDRVQEDPRIKVLQARISDAAGRRKAELYAELNSLTQQIHLEKQAEVAAEFDGIHSVERALRVGSIHEIIPPSDLRLFLIRALEKGTENTEI